MTEQPQPCPECDGTGRKWFRLPDDVGSPYAAPCPRGCPMIELPVPTIEYVETAHDD